MKKMLLMLRSVLFRPSCSSVLGSDDMVSIYRLSRGLHGPIESRTQASASSPLAAIGKRRIVELTLREGACHGAGGSGASGPSLKNERSRKDVTATIQWIENPAPPVPELFPGTLSAADVQVVAAFVQTL